MKTNRNKNSDFLTNTIRMKKKTTNDVLFNDKRQLVRVAFLIVYASLFLLKSQKRNNGVLFE